MDELSQNVMLTGQEAIESKLVLNEYDNVYLAY